MTDHGSKVNPWHRPHDAYVNTSFNLALEHYAMVISEFGDIEQKAHLKKLRHDAVEARWELLELLTKDAKFGPKGVCTTSTSGLRVGGGRPRKVTVADYEECQEVEGEEVEDQEMGEEQEEQGEESEEEEVPPPKKKGRMIYEDCELGMAKIQGMCAIKGCKGKPTHGCKAHGVRLCFPKCLDLHLKGCGIINVAKGSQCKRAPIVWKK